jgi:hypothetical protein
MNLNQISVKIGDIKRKNLPDMLRIWNLYANLLTSSNKILTIELINKMFDGRNEINHEYNGLFIQDELKGFMVLHFENGGVRIKMTAIDPLFQG